MMSVLSGLLVFHGTLVHLNRGAVEAIMKVTEKKLSKNPDWREIYELQLRTLVEKKFAVEISEKDIVNWRRRSGDTYFISNQMAINTQSKTTPVWVVFNCSQTYRGYSLNSSWEQGPNLINNLPGILLRFRNDLEAAQGSIKSELRRKRPGARYLCGSLQVKTKFVYSRWSDLLWEIL